jgi:hypothetical protein
MNSQALAYNTVLNSALALLKDALRAISLNATSPNNQKIIPKN